MVEEEIALNGLILIKPKVLQDDRGIFFESYNSSKFNDIALESMDFYQDNVSISKKNVLRGLHFQKPPKSQGKLVQVIKGSVLDVAVDIRLHSPTYGQHYKVELNDKNRLQLWIPEGFAHGFVTLEDNTIFSYKCTSAYSKSDEMDLRWNDPLLDIDWGVSSPLLSDKDEMAASFENFNSPFK
jgi:dTDP-4-dehydrorhamnose 3,5-epimerase